MAMIVGIGADVAPLLLAILDTSGIGVSVNDIKFNVQQPLPIMVGIVI